MIVEHVPVMVLVKDADTLRFVLCNAAGEAILGVSREHVLGYDDHALFPADQADAFVARDRDALVGGTPIELVEKISRAASGTRVLRTRRIPVLDASGRPRYLLRISEDVTERRQLELRLHRVQSRLQHAQRMEHVGRLAAGVAHDLNNLLTVMSVSAADAAAQLPEDHPVFVELRSIASASARATELIQRLLTLGRPQVLAPQVIDLRVVVRDLEPLLRRLLGPDVQLSIVAASATASVLADPGQLDRVLMNLVANANDAMPAGGRLTIEVDADTPRADVVCLTVRDTGRGMDAGTRARAFEPFFTTNASGRGTGLGLVTVHDIVKEWGGHVAVDSVPGEGTAFRISFPRAGADPDHGRQKTRTLT